MQIPVEAIRIKRETDGAQSQIEVTINVTLPIREAGNLMRILSTNVLEIQDAEWKAVKVD